MKIDEKEFKTLKDIEDDPIVMQHCNRVVSSQDLRQEAINWVKWFEAHEQDATASEFIKFFNLTDEDLK